MVYQEFFINKKKFRMVTFLIAQFLLSLPFIVGISVAAFEQRDTAARPSAMAFCYSACGNDAATVFFSPAGFAFCHEPEISLSGGRFFPEATDDNLIVSADIAAAFPLSSTSGSAGGVGFGIHTFGMNLYSERLAVLAVGVPIFKKIGIGSALRWHELTIRGCGTLNVLSIDAGTQLKYSEKFRLAAFFRNLTGASLTDFSDDLPRGGEIAVAYWPLNGSVVTCGAEKYSLQDTAFSIAIEQRIFNFFDLRCGFKTGVARFSAGYGFRWKGIRFEQGFVYQEFLGPQTLFTVSFFAPPAQGPHKLDLPYQDKGLYTGEKLNINTASERDLLLLPKIGKSVAKNIISYRIEHGFFRKIDDIMNVKRIGPKTFEKIRNYITVGESFSLKPAKKNLGIATENDLISLGIPPMTAVRIIKWKGGRVKFHSIKELRTVEGITDDDLKVIKECFEFEEENDLP